jgi:transposase-like protein
MQFGRLWDMIVFGNLSNGKGMTMEGKGLQSKRGVKGVSTKWTREERAEIKQKAYELRLRGRTYQSIAEEIGIHRKTLTGLIQEALDETLIPLSSEIRKQEFDRLHRYLDKLDDRIEAGDMNAIALAIRVSESLRKMLGVDIPVTSNTVVEPDNKVQLEIVTLVQQVQARNKAVLERIAGTPAAIESSPESEDVPEAEIVE